MLDTRGQRCQLENFSYNNHEALARRRHACSASMARDSSCVSCPQTQSSASAFARLRRYYPASLRSHRPNHPVPPTQRWGFLTLFSRQHGTWCFTGTRNTDVRPRAQKILPGPALGPCHMIDAQARSRVVTRSVFRGLVDTKKRAGTCEEYYKALRLCGSWEVSACIRSEPIMGQPTRRTPSRRPGS